MGGGEETAACVLERRSRVRSNVIDTECGGMLSEEGFCAS